MKPLPGCRCLGHYQRVFPFQAVRIVLGDDPCLVCLPGNRAGQDVALALRQQHFKRRFVVRSGHIVGDVAIHRICDGTIGPQPDSTLKSALPQTV